MKTSSNEKHSKITANWTSSDTPPQNGRSAVITGTGGIGFQNALEIARAGGEVIIAGRNPQKGKDAIAKIRAEIPSAHVRFEVLDLADLQSVADFGARLRSQRDNLDLLINNAAVMMPPERKETSDGFELQFATNYLGHFALTAHLLPLLRNGKDSRVVTLSSIAARSGAIDFDDLQSNLSYRPMRAYAQTKLACLMFALELQRRSTENGWGLSSIGAHPGISRTELIYNGSGRKSLHGFARTLLWFLFQPASQGALPSLFAATSPQAEGGKYYGPDGLAETRGAPAVAIIPKQAQDLDASSQLWEVSERLTHVTAFSSGTPADGVAR
jgi:NAD(P)-dependent dehydrogenase (short-subunit alcohol dehydrogenase family)